MEKAFLGILIAYCMNANTQTPKDSLIAPGTTISVSEKQISIKTTNDSINNTLMANKEKAFKIYAYRKKDRQGIYWQTIYYFKPEEYQSLNIKF